MVPSAAALAWLRELRGHRRDQAVEASFARQLRVERSRYDVAVPYRDYAAVIQLRHHIDVRTHSLDDGRSDEHRVDRTVTENGHGHLRLKAFQLSTKGVALDRDVEQREDGRVTVG